MAGIHVGAVDQDVLQGVRGVPQLGSHLLVVEAAQHAGHG
jgi:hypothetical protein